MSKGSFSKTIKYDELVDDWEGDKHIWKAYKGDKHVATINVTDKKIFC